MTRSRTASRPSSAAPDAPLESVIAELTPAIGQIVRRLRSVGNPDELSLSQSSALARLEQGGLMTTADLARAEAMKPQSMKSILASLEEEGCVERQAHPTDGRQILFALTPKGLEERRRRTAAKREWLIEALSQFDQTELQTLAAAIPLLRRLGNS
jgi:DNA-binding MarR family transcriptional regulator